MMQFASVSPPQHGPPSVDLAGSFEQLIRLAAALGPFAGVLENVVLLTGAGLILALFWGHVKAILDAIGSRIARGDDLDAIGLRIRQFVPAGADAQAAQLSKQADEARQAGVQREGAAVDVADRSEINDAVSTALVTDVTSDIKSKIVFASDLAVRRIQLEVNRPIVRDQKIGTFIADGFFSTNEIINLISVKYVVEGGVAPRIRSAIREYRESQTLISLRRTRLILIVVYESSSHLTFQEERDAFDATKLATNFEIDLRLYTLESLKDSFRI